MPLSLQDKQNIVVKIREISKKAMSAVVVNYRGITVDKMNDLRKVSREAEVHVCVIRNTLLRRIVEDTTFECLKDIFVGPTMIAFSMRHPGTAARLFKDFAKINTKLEIKAAAFEGRLIPALQIDQLALLPTYEESITLLILTIKEASFSKLVRILFTIRNLKEIT